MRNRIITFMLTLSLVLSLAVWAMPEESYAAGGLPSVNDVSVCHTPASDYRPGDCILTSTKCMLRRASIARGSAMWTKFTNAAIRKTAAPHGLLLHNITIKADGITYQIGCAKFKSVSKIKGEAAKNKARTDEIREILKKHPEGIVVWGSNAATCGMHGILAVSVSGNTIYAIDSTHNRGNLYNGVEKWQNTTMRGVYRCTQYWYMKAISGTSASASGGAENSTLTLTGLNIPKTIKQGKGFGVVGLVESNYMIKNVSVEVLDSQGKPQLQKSVATETWTYNLVDVDNDVKFGTLKPGNYTYRISAADDKKTAVLHQNTFTVTGPTIIDKIINKVTGNISAKPITTYPARGAKSKLRVTSLRIPGSIPEGNSFSISGKVRSNKKIRRVEIQIVNSSGRTVLSAGSNMKKKTYNLRKLDSKVKFGKLQAGTYRFKLIARDTKQSKVLVNAAFEVTPKS